jgi:Spy/CpxP family protein refolding chaperone
MGCDKGTQSAPTSVGSAVLNGAEAAASAAVGPAGSTPGDDVDESTSDLRDHDLHHHHGGFAMFIAMSLDLLGVTAEQSVTISKIQLDLYSEMKPAHDAEKKVLLTLAEGVASGHVDKAKVDSDAATLSAAASGLHDLVAASLDRLHETLTPPQRAALVDKVEAHFQVWSDVNSPEALAERDTHRGHLAKLTTELALTPDQVEKVRAGIKSSTADEAGHFKPAEADAHLKAFSKAFASDTFDARSLGKGAEANAEMAAWGGRRVALFYEAVTPVLTPDQRTKLSALLRRHANYKRTETDT